MEHIIRGKRVFLRPFERADAETYRRWRADAGPMDLASLAERAAQPGRRREADRGAHRGVRNRVNGSAELGIFIGEPDEWGKGYGTDAVNALVVFAFAELRLERIGLTVWIENARARRAYERAGFVFEGTLRHDRYEHGAYTDGHLMSILRDEWLALPRRADA